MNDDRTRTTTAGTSVNPVGAGDMIGRTTAAGLFPDRAAAEQAIRDLLASGFTSDRIGVAARDRAEQVEPGEETGTHAAAGATSGLFGGGLVGGALGLLVGIGALAIPGIGPVVAGGVLASAFGVAGGTAVAGAGIGAATGGIVGALVGLGIPEAEAQQFETGIRAGRTLVTVGAGGRAMEALAILRRNGADSGPGSTRSTRPLGGVVGVTAGGAAAEAAGTAGDSPTGGGSDRSGG